MVYANEKASKGHKWSKYNLNVCLFFILNVHQIVYNFVWLITSLPINGIINYKCYCWGRTSVREMLLVV
jgi:hypothetical protein